MSEAEDTVPDPEEVAEVEQEGVVGTEGTEEAGPPPADYDDILKQLEGTTVLVQPRVSRETILAVIKQHTGILMNLESGFEKMKENFLALQGETTKNTEHLSTLDTDLGKTKETIVDIQGRCDTFRTEIDSIQNTLTDVYTLKTQMREQQFALEELTSKFKAHTSEIAEYLSSTDTKLNAVDALNKETQFKLIELKEYVDHFGDNLILSSSQITVESAIGFSNRPTALRDVLKTVNKYMKDNTETIDNHEGRIQENADVVATKADATIVMDVGQINTRVQTIEIHLKKEEETGISAIRKTCDDLTVSVESIIADLAEKVDARNVDSIVHKKYEDIVEYLQQALASNQEDEQNFNAKAKQMELDMRRMAAGKADRVEIQKMQESIVKNEAMMTKFSNQMRPSELGKLKDIVSRAELMDLLEQKMSRMEFEAQIKDITKSLKKKSRTLMMSGSMPEMEAASGGVPNQQGQADETMHARMAEHMGGRLQQQQQRGDNSAPASSDQSRKDDGVSFPVVPGVGAPRGPEAIDDTIYDVRKNSPKTTPTYPTVPPNFTKGSGQNLSVLGAATHGGGFNTLKKVGEQKEQGSLAPLNDIVGGGPDVEGLGLMVEGTDGHLYYGDEIPDKQRVVASINIAGME